MVRCWGEDGGGAGLRYFSCDEVEVGVWDGGCAVARFDEGARGGGNGASGHSRGVVSEVSVSRRVWYEAWAGG